LLALLRHFKILPFSLVAFLRRDLSSASSCDHALLDTQPTMEQSVPGKGKLSCKQKRKLKTQPTHNNRKKGRENEARAAKGRKTGNAPQSE